MARCLFAYDFAKLNKAVFIHEVQRIGRGVI